jgi:hypothetical protein
MRLANSIMLRNSRLRFSFIVFSLISVPAAVMAQDNSPYSRYGLGDMLSGTNVITRGLGGISAAYSDIISVNFNNPASYSQFYTLMEPRTGKVAQGRVILDVGLNFGSRTLVAPNTPNKFTASDGFFSYVQVGIPIRRKWGLTFGIRPLSRINYLIGQRELLRDPVSGQPIDSAYTEYEGRGGSFLPTIGTGFGIGKFSFGANIGYLFGNKDLSTRRTLFNDTVTYYASDHSTKTSFGNIFFNAGIQYTDTLSRSHGAVTILRLGVSGNWKQNINASQDVLRQTFFRGSAGEELRLDSVSQQAGVSGTIVYPGNYKAGFVVQNSQENGKGFLFGVDYSIGKWSEYRFMGNMDSVQDSWQLNAGVQLVPKPQANYFSRVVYRFGGYSGKEYIKVGNDLNIYGLSFGLGLPIGNYNRISAGQFSMVNLSLEYAKRGNNDNLLKENLFRLSVGLNFTDLWFIKRKYE